MNVFKYKGSVYGISLALLSAITTGTFGVFVNYFQALGISEDALGTFVPCVIFCFAFISILIKKPKSLILPQKKFYFTLLICSGLIASPLYIYSSIRSVNSLPIAVASLLDFSNAIVLVFLMRFCFKKKITKEKLIATVIALFGISLVLNLFAPGNSTITNIGIFWGITNCISLAIAYVFDYYHISNGISYLAYLTYTNFMGLLLFSFRCTPIQMFKEFVYASHLNNFSIWFFLFGYIAVLIISYSTIAISYKYIDASVASLTFVAEPSVAAILGFTILHQHLNFFQIIGILITIVAVIYLEYTGNKQDQKNLQTIKET